VSTYKDSKAATEVDKNTWKKAGVEMLTACIQLEEDRGTIKQN